MSSNVEIEGTVVASVAWLLTDAGARFIARRVRVGATWAVREQDRLDRWFAVRACRTCN